MREYVVKMKGNVVKTASDVVILLCRDENVVKIRNNVVKMKGNVVKIASDVVILLAREKML